MYWYFTNLYVMYKAQMDLLRANTASLRSSLALMKHRCVGMEPDAVIQDPVRTCLMRYHRSD